MGETDLGIANLALIDLGQPALATGQEASVAGRLFRASFEPTVKEVLRLHPWRCCRAQIKLTQDPDAIPPFGFAFSHRLPSDFVKVIKFEDNIEKFEIVGDHLQCDFDTPELTYVARKPTAQFDSLLVSTIAARLSWRWCKALTESANAAKEYKDVFATIIAEAKFADALDGAPEEQPMGTWASARLSEA